MDRDELRQRWLRFYDRLPAREERIRRAAFQRIRQGESLTVELLAPEGIPDLPVTLDRMAEAGLITRSERGDITGAAGLSLTPTRYPILLDGVQLYTWCAWDAAGIPAALGADARAAGRCADSEQAIGLVFQRGELLAASHPGAGVWLVPPERQVSLCGVT